MTSIRILSSDQRIESSRMIVLSSVIISVSTLRPLRRLSLLIQTSDSNHTIYQLNPIPRTNLGDIRGDDTISMIPSLLDHTVYTPFDSEWKVQVMAESVDRETAYDSTPIVGMTGGSYGGGIRITTEDR